jgi:hypothetical protein
VRQFAAFHAKSLILNLDNLDVALTQNSYTRELQIHREVIDISWQKRGKVGSSSGSEATEGQESDFDSSDDDEEARDHIM